MSPSRPYRLKGGALAYTLLISLLVTLGLGSVMMLWSWNRIEQDHLYFKELAWDNAESARNLVLHGEAYGLGTYAEGLFESAADSFSAEFTTWGVYGLLNVAGIHGSARAERSFIIGQSPEGPWEASLLLRDRNRPLTLAGKTRIEGLAYLPEAGVKRGFVGAQAYQGAQLLYGSRRSSRNLTLSADWGAFPELREWLQVVEKGQWESGEMLLSDSLHQVWSGESKVLSQKRTLVLDQQKLSGRIVLIAPEIHLFADARCADVLLIGERIYLHEGFSGTIQAFARDSLLCESRVHLGYPSSLAVWSPEGKGALLLGSETEVQGLIVNDAALFGGTQKRNQDSFTSIPQTARVFGNVYVPENLDLQGEVQGNVLTGKFILRSPSAYYENHLLDARISRQDLDSSYAMPLISDQAPAFTLIKELP